VKYCIFLFKTLISNIFRDTCFMSRFADCVHKITICLKFTTPQRFLHLRVKLEYFSGGYTFYHRDDRRCTHPGNRLDQIMNMDFVFANLKKMDIVSRLNFQTNILKSIINTLGENNSAIFGRTHKMVQQYAYIL